MQIYKSLKRQCRKGHLFDLELGKIFINKTQGALTIKEKSSLRISPIHSGTIREMKGSNERKYLQCI